MSESQMSGKLPEARLSAGGSFTGSDAFETELGHSASGVKRAS